MPEKLTIIRPEAKRGRKQALATVSEQQIQEAENAMQLGFPQSRVAGLLGISEAALSRAMKRDDGIGERLQRAKAEGHKKQSRRDTDSRRQVMASCCMAIGTLQRIAICPT